MMSLQDASDFLIGDAACAKITSKSIFCVGQFGSLMGHDIGIRE
jgi:hypothetical protein